MTLKQIQILLKFRDKANIARKLGTSTHYVCRVVNGYVNENSPLARRIITEAAEVAASNMKELQPETAEVQ